MKKEDIIDRLNQVREEVSFFAKKANRDPSSVTIVAVSKKQPVEYIRWAYEAGQRDFGENYIQEGLEKIEKLKEKEIRFHYIGRCQSNKAKYIPGRFVLIHSVDSLKFARELNKRCEKLDTSQEILIEVNVAKESTKGGLLPEDVCSFVENILRETQKLILRGLMCMPPYFEDPEKVRPYFRELRKLKEEVERKFQIDLPHLSMGMSSDFKQAILEGATLVRIGTSIFGPRGN